MSISSNNNSLYRRFAKDFKRKDKSFLKNLTYTQLEKEMKKELFKIDDLIEEKNKIEYHRTEYRTPIDGLLNTVTLLINIFALCISILSMSSEIEITIDFTEELINCVKLVALLYFFMLIYTYISKPLFDISYNRSEIYRKMKLKCINEILNNRKKSKLKKVRMLKSSANSKNHLYYYKIPTALK